MIKGSKIDGAAVTIDTAAGANKFDASGANQDYTKLLNTAQIALTLAKARTALAKENLDNTKKNKTRADTLLATLRTERDALNGTVARLEW